MRALSKVLSLYPILIIALAGCTHQKFTTSRVEATRGVRIMFVDSLERTAFDRNHKAVSFPKEFAEDSFFTRTSRSIGASLYDNELQLVAKVGDVFLINPREHFFGSTSGQKERVFQIPLPAVNKQTNTRAKLWATERNWATAWKGKVGVNKSGAIWSKLSDGSWDLTLILDLPEDRSLTPLFKFRFDQGTESELVDPVIQKDSIKLHLTFQLDPETPVSVESRAARLVFDEQIQDFRISRQPSSADKTERPRVEFLGVLPCNLDGTSWSPALQGWTRDGTYEATGGSERYVGYGTSGKCDMVYVDFRIRNLPVNATVSVLPVGKRFGFGQICTVLPSLDGDGRIYSAMVDRLHLPDSIDVEVRIGEGPWEFLDSVSKPYSGASKSQPAQTLSHTVYPPPATSEEFMAKVLPPRIPSDLRGRFYDSLGREVKAFGRTTMSDGVGIQRAVQKLALPITRVDVYHRPLKVHIVKSVPLRRPVSLK